MIEIILITTLIWLPLIVVIALIVAFLVYLVVKAHGRKVETGNEGLLGEAGIYKGDGKVFIHGELWKVESHDQLNVGDKIVVEGVERMLLRVRKID
jgi:membrane-bound serine protease (ClpP class)